MNKIISLFLTCFMVWGNYSTAQWEIINEGFKGWVINTMDFVNEYTGWLAGNNGTLCKTSDGGINWNDIPIDESWTVNHLDFINESVGWGVVSRCDSVRCYAVIIKSLDGGNTWQLQKQINDISLNRILIIDENYVFVIGDRIYKTSDGGINWTGITPVYNTYYNSIWFRDSLNGVVTGYFNESTMILKTTNGGISWVSSDKYSPSGSFKGLQFINDTTGYFFYHKDTLTCFCRTEDMLSSWTILAEIDGNMSSFQVVETELIYATGSFREGTLIKSTDGGTTWQNLTSGYSTVLNKHTMGIEEIYGKAPPHYGINLGGIYIIGKNLAFITGDIQSYPFLFRSTDLEDWKLQRFSFPLNDVSFFNHNKVLVAGGWFFGSPHGVSSGGCIFFTDNYGINWTAASPSELKYQSCLFLDENNIVISCPAGFIKSTNSGNAWTEYKLYDTLGNSFWVSDICLADINTGFAAGNYWESESSGAGILQTQDQGETWEIVFRYPNINDNWYYFSSICFTGTTGWTVGERVSGNDPQTSGVIFKYTPQTGWVKKDSLTDLSFNKVFFTDENHGWITGGYHDIWNSTLKSIYLKTTDGGESWKVNETFPYLINDLYFTDNEHGWAVGNDSLGRGVILESTDGGETWTVEMDNLIAQLKSIYIKDNCAWTVGNNGLILRNTTDIVRLEEEKNNYPSEFVLEQNFPNPFNPSTIISYQLPVAGLVRLKVFDILGNEAAALVDEYKPAGNYKVEFNAKKLASGVYFYQLKAGDFISTKKMILMK